MAEVIEIRPTVCLLNDSFPPLIDGVATATLQYAQNITKNHGNVVVVTPDYPRTEYPAYPYPVIHYPSLNTTRLVAAGYRTGVPFYAPTIKEISSYPVSLLHTHCPFMSTYLARTYRESHPMPLIFTYHTKFDVDIARSVKNEHVRNAATRLMIGNISACDEVWVVSRGAGENLRSLGYEGDYQLMENGVDFPRGRAPEKDISALKKQLMQEHGIDTDDGTPLFLFVGRMMWYKGVRLILDALASLKEKNIPYHMILIGDGKDLPEIKKTAAELSVADRCIFTGAIRDRDVLRTYYSIASVFLFPSTYDTNGIVVREAAAAGCPSMLIQGSCAAEGITDDRNGFLVDENATSVAAFLCRAAKDLSHCKDVGMHAMQEIYLSWEDAVARAWDRYEIVSERYNRGLCQAPRKVTDEFFAGMALILQAINRVDGAWDNFRQKIR